MLKYVSLNLLLHECRISTVLTTSFQILMLPVLYPGFVEISVSVYLSFIYSSRRIRIAV
jgi:hypothetical protein